MLQRRNLLIAGAFLAVIVGLGLTARALDQAAAQGGGTVQAPKFEVDPMWPKPLPNNMLLGNVNKNTTTAARIDPTTRCSSIAANEFSINIELSPTMRSSNPGGSVPLML